MIEMDQKYQEVARTEYVIEQDVLKLLAGYYKSAQDDPVKPIVRIYIENSSGKYLNNKQMEESLENLVANPG